MVHGQEALWLQEKGKHKSSNTDGEFLRGVALYTGMEGPELYGKSVENLGLYVSTQFKKWIRRDEVPTKSESSEV